ncbi:hypothetical protein OL330_000860 [Vibrio parahaemolyticus]|uniref:hypothetical protein n=1 Tax=Vibrio parahaemolyticus TaxID=670 RepID=UPI001120596E|nr:hypothetical protein [Vibrio parahaemolyticus]EKA7371671.1 hypothetical protein [Vibrio parahaemolyticus]ELA3125005.1 hypothetical protein [Vibrio parahaemolyticus]ELA9375735.1 hypothetical protein [Vibrio parahaemolyticus]MBE3763142.1 hypothetical protein [Vibrio parahaemolyticus]TOQ18621.1 hypothetical protein CGH00_23120 [Vibrio parahaemolyticus]
MDSKSDFIMAAIQDCQATIRATDVKVGALLAGLLLPFSQITQVWKYLDQLSTFIECNAVTYLFFALWFLAICSLVRTISAIDNPSNHIVNESTCKGAFYGARLYRFGFLDSLLNREVIKADKDIASFAETYPDTPDGIELELSFEHMKLIYIREIKMHRLDFSLKIAALWFILGICAFLYLKANM